MNNSPIQPQANSSKLMLIVAIIVAVLVFGGIALWYFMTQPASTQTATTTTPSQTQSTTITNDSDLQAASTDLDKTDVDSLDTSLSQNDTDASQF